MKKINWLAWWLVGAITCGIYNLYGWYVLSKNNNEIAEKRGYAKNRLISEMFKGTPYGLPKCGTEEEVAKGLKKNDNDYTKYLSSILQDKAKETDQN
jgi:hypothetical protein